MEQPYQQIIKDLQQSDNYTNLAQTTAPAMTISGEACMLLDKTSVMLAESKDASGVNWCIRKELINALACLDELEKAVTGVQTPTSTIFDKQEQSSCNILRSHCPLVRQSGKTCTGSLPQT